MVLLVAASTLAALPRGGVPPWAQAAALAASALALVLALLAEPQGAPGLAFLAPGLVALVAALQCVPLPAALLRFLAKTSWDLRAFPPLQPPAFAPLSLDQAATLGAVALPVALACAAAAAALVARGTRERLWLCAAPLAAALVQAALAFSRFDLQRFAGTFVNRNHQAALFSCGALIALGGALGRSRRLLWGCAAVACGAGTLLTLSRGGALSLGFGALFLLALRTQKARPARASLALVVILGIAAAATCAALWLSSDALRARVDELAPSRLRTEVKLRSFVGAAQVAQDHLLVGAGRGVYPFVSESHRSVPGEVTFYYVENEPLQLAVDLGAPAALAVLSLLLLAFWRGARRGDLEGLEQGALAGLVALAAQNLVDFDLELLGVALPAAVALGALQTGSARLRPALVALLVAAPLSAFALFAAQKNSAEVESSRLLALGNDSSISADLLEQEARAAAGRHPADWLVSLAPALGLYQRAPLRTGPALAWAGRAMQLAPQAFRPHAVAAAILLRAGHRSQARVETRLALSGERYSVLPWEVIGLAARASTGLDELLEATPDEPLVRASLVGRLRTERRLPEAVALAQAVLASGAGAARAALLGHLAALAMEAHDADAAQRWAAELKPLDPCASARFRGSALEAQRQSDEAEKERLRGLAACPGDRALGEDLVRGRLLRGDAPGALLSFDQLDAERPDSGWAADAHLLHAQLFEALRRPARALAQRFLAAELAPERPDLALDYANRLAAAGDRAGAREALRRLAPRAQGVARALLDRRLAELELRAAP